MDNPFLNPTTPPKTPAEIRTPHTAGQFPIIKKIANASESFQNLAPVLDFDETFLLPPDLKNSLGTRKPEPVDSIFATHDKHKEKHEILKVLLVASTQGRKFSLDFEQVRVAGKGAFSEVLQARHRLDGCTYAIKRNITPLMSDKSRLDSLQEVFALSALQGHPNILRYHDAWFEEKGRYLHMQTEFLSEGTLYALFIERGKRMPSEELLALAADLSSALAFMHSKGVVHLDVKPDNIFRSNRRRTQNSFIIGDFGLACHMDGTDARSTEGDSRYLCPEAMDGSPKQIPDTEEDLSDCASDDEDLIGDTLKPAAPQDLRARDVFSLGATIYELAVGLPLKKSGEEWRQLRSDTARAAKEAGAACGSSEIANIVQVCLEANPSRRALACDVVDICEANSSREQSRYINQLHMQLDQLKRQLSRHQKVTNNLLKNGERNRKRYREQCANGKKRFPPCAV
ncbi:Serine/threonine protein kinase [Chondrus crispus]|uniref:Serine/threonine protein kinase n=1 Tax=Chondrus crispus TaxID=2769 RepID=R7QJY5_CHOCR|nr:Serine/threonine protein kinase [Chondrus crispus]CDF38837.1 Serine/threonine protein kinase [Chondrus crispus]|eukprot:XP_005718742.1 Serine/threonine protein kinase [Chondrus crispus]